MLCFVICPIGSKGSEQRRHSDNLFHDVIQPALIQLDFPETSGIIRADKVENPGIINDQVIDFILNSDLIVADLSFHNPNAFYELGIADHAGKPVILFSRKDDQIPFDKSNDRVIIADLGDYHERKSAREAVKRFAEAALEPSHKVSNPVTQAKAYHAFQASADPKEKMIAELQRRVSTLEVGSLERSMGRNSSADNRDWNISEKSSAAGNNSFNQSDEDTYVINISGKDNPNFLLQINESISASDASVLNERAIHEHVRATLKLTAKDRVIKRISRLTRQHPDLARKNGDYIQKLLINIQKFE